jgi:hypothetical protein
LDDAVIARAVHVSAVVLWIDGVGFVTTVLLPARRSRSDGLFRCIRAAICMASPYHHRADRALPAVHADPVRPLGSLPLRHAMVVVWLLFTVMLYLAEPLFLHRWLDARAKAKPKATFRLVEWMHWLLLTLGAITILGAVAGSHGLLLLGFA